MVQASSTSHAQVHYDEEFTSPEYLAFREAMSKVALENRVHVKDNFIVVGKNRYNVPNFVNYQDYINQLEEERSVLLMKYNDVYERIVISERPDKFKSMFDDLVTKINNIEVLIDEVRTFIETRNKEHVADKLQQQIDGNNDHANQLIDNSKGSVVVDTAITKQIISLYKANLNLHNSLNEAKHTLPHDYIIVKKEQSAPRKALRHSTLTKRQKVKTAVKKLMIDKLQ
jgi:hypothetical protein